MKQTIQIFARVKPTVRKQPQGVRVGAARVPGPRGRPGRGEGLGVGRSQGASWNPAHSVRGAQLSGRGQTDTRALPPSTAL